ncbi:integration host factor, actinobacterial type [Streptomyces sp. NPDC059262]|uniref:integration host factor, actinobacterial type n=1 Tax=Streptomyces sp. NPDC059262 TaxID=3346797 RepID=UPI0036A0810C
MPLPALTAEARAENLRKAAAVRRERGELLDALKHDRTSLQEVLDRDDPVVGRMLVKRLLEGLPNTGKIRAAQLLADLDISERRRVQGLGSRQKARLLELFPPQA